MRVEMTFNNAAIADHGYRRGDIYYTIKKAFTGKGLVCISEDELLAFEDTGHENDYAYMWNVIKSLMISDWFLSCASSCEFIDDDDTAEDVLSQAHLFKRRSTV